MLLYGCSRCVPAAHRHFFEVEGLLRTLGPLVLALQSSGADTAAVAPSVDIVSLVLHASFVVQLVLAGLILFSATSWGIIVYKYVMFRRAAKQTAMFLDVFRKSNRFSEVQSVCAGLAGSPLAGLFQAGIAPESHPRSCGQRGRPAERRQQAGRRGAASCISWSLEAVDRALLSRIDHGGRAMARGHHVVPRDDRIDHFACGTSDSLAPCGAS